MKTTKQKREELVAAGLTKSQANNKIKYTQECRCIGEKKCWKGGKK